MGVSFPFIILPFSGKSKVYSEKNVSFFRTHNMWISCGYMCTTYRVVHSGWKGFSTFFKCTEHPFFCRIERLFDARLFRQILSKNGEKKLSTKNILYYYNYYFHVPIKKGLVVGSRTRVREGGSEYARKKSPTE